MAKPTAPLLSFGASGQIAKTMVYGTWKGQAYVRRHVIPANPQSSEQSLTRNAFTFLQNVYKFAPAGVTEVWDAYARGKTLTPRNAFTKLNLANLRPAVALTLLTISGGALGGSPPVSVTPTPGAGQISCAIAVPSSVAPGWVLHSAFAAAIRDGDPHTATNYLITVGSDASAPYVVVLTGLTAGLNQVRAWLKWTRPDGTFAYSPDIATTSTVT